MARKKSFRVRGSFWSFWRHIIRCPGLGLRGWFEVHTLLYERRRSLSPHQIKAEEVYISVQEACQVRAQCCARQFVDHHVLRRPESVAERHVVEIIHNDVEFTSRVPVVAKVSLSRAFAAETNVCEAVQMSSSPGVVGPSIMQCGLNVAGEIGHAQAYRPGR